MWSAFEVSRSRAPMESGLLDDAVASGALGGVAVAAQTASTNSDLVEALARDPRSWPHLSVLVTDHQTAGRGRSGRSWETPPGAALTMSVVLERSRLGEGPTGWAPLVVGVGVARALRASGVEAGVKWPNDVVLRAAVHLDGWGPWRKCAGILCEADPHGGAVVAGIGINVSQHHDELPVAHATSLALAGSTPVTREELVVAVVQAVADAVAQWRSAGVSGVSHMVHDACVTMGQDVTVDVPGGASIEGIAEALDHDGGLVVQLPSGRRHTVYAGDVKVRLP